MSDLPPARFPVFFERRSAERAYARKELLGAGRRAEIPFRESARFAR
ncbi:MAG: hypothetical protein ACRDTH_24705 [Pseudonocardiaceae bacterium]